MDPSSSAILFDIDGTLIDSTYHHAVAWQRAFDTLGLPIPLWQIHRTVGMGGDKLVGQVAGTSVEERQGDDLRKRWRKEYSELRAEVRPLPGASELICQLASQGYHVALASSGDPEFSREAVDLLDIADHVELLTTSADVEASKPEPDLLRATLSQLDGVDHAVMVGDTPYDVESARRAGLQCVCLRSGGYGEAELRDAGTPLVVGSPQDLQDLEWGRYLFPVR